MHPPLPTPRRHARACPVPPPPPPSARAQETRDQIAHLEDHNRLLEDREKDSVLRVEALNETIVQAEEKCKELEQTLKDTKKSCVIC